MTEILIGIGCTFGLGWVSWVSLTLVRNYNNGADVSGLKEAFNSMKKDIKEEIDKVNIRQDRFIQNEIQELKDLVRDK